MITKPNITDSINAIVGRVRDKAIFLNGLDWLPAGHVPLLEFVSSDKGLRMSIGILGPGQLGPHTVHVDKRQIEYWYNLGRMEMVEQDLNNCLTGFLMSAVCHAVLYQHEHSHEMRSVPQMALDSAPKTPDAE